MKEKNKEILNYYGIEKQIPVWIEEMSELIKELCKRQRKGSFNNEMYENTKLEITDVQVCLDQMKTALNYTIEEQDKNYIYKVNRQLERIKNENNNLFV